MADDVTVESHIVAICKSPRALQPSIVYPNRARPRTGDHIARSPPPSWQSGRGHGEPRLSPREGPYFVCRNALSTCNGYRVDIIMPVRSVEFTGRFQ